MIENERFQQRRSISHQKWLRKKLLALLPTDLRTVLESSTIVCSPDDAEIISYTDINAVGIGKNGSLLPPNYTYTEYSFEPQLFEVVGTYPNHHDIDAGWFQPFGVRSTPGDSMNDLLDNRPPVFEVPFGWGRSNLRELFYVTQYGLAILSKTFAAAIVIQMVVGRLDSNPNPDERIYQVATWK